MPEHALKVHVVGEDESAEQRRLLLRREWYGWVEREGVNVGVGDLGDVSMRVSVGVGVGVRVRVRVSVEVRVRVRVGERKSWMSASVTISRSAPSSERGFCLMIVATSPTSSLPSSCSALRDDTVNLDERHNSRQPPKQHGPSTLASGVHPGPARSMTLSVGVNPPASSGCVAKLTHCALASLTSPGCASPTEPAWRYMPSLQPAVSAQQPSSGLPQQPSRSIVSTVGSVSMSTTILNIGSIPAATLGPKVR